jgi:riboflavin kinase, archaea type
VVVKLTGVIQSGVKHSTSRMTKHPAVFEAATGQKLYPGTLNVKLAERVTVREHFRIVGAMINEPEQDLLFEICRVNGKWAYRIRPYNLKNGSGGHGDDVIEIACAEHLKASGLKDGDKVEIEFFR